MPLGPTLARHALRSPDALAVSLADTRLTYGDLYDHICRLNTALNALPRRARRTLTLPDHARIFALSTGNHTSAPLLLATALATPHAAQVMDAQWPAAQLAKTLSDHLPDVLFCLSSQTRLIDTATSLGIPVVAVDTDLTALLAGPPTRPRPAAATDTFLVGFTSGTTSRPKAFARARRSWRLSLDASAPAFDLTAQSHTFAPGPLAHGITLYALAETLDAGAAFYALPQFDLAAAHRALDHATRIVAVPSLLRALTTGPAMRPQITNITTAGAKLDPDLIARAFARFPDATLYEYYGASELGFVSLCRHRRAGSSAPPHTVGHPFPHVDLSIRHNGAPVPEGETGTIHVRGDLAIDGYLVCDSAAPPQSGFRRDGPWATVGDLGRLSPDGSLTLMGREGGMIITAGHNVYPQEVETALAALPGVTGAVVLGLPHPTRGQQLIAVVSGTPPPLRAALLPHLPRYKIPRRAYRVAGWPLTSSGKIARATVETWLKTEDARLVPISG